MEIRGDIGGLSLPEDTEEDYLGGMAAKNTLPHG